MRAGDRRPSLGTRLKRLRTAKGWTLKEMSARSGIPVSTLCKVEHDRLTLTYDKLQQVSARLDVSLPDLFAALESEPPPPTADRPTLARRSIGGLATAVKVSAQAGDCYHLCPDLRRKRMLPTLTRIRARSLEEFGALVRHDGEAFIYVLEGRVAVHTEYYEPAILGPGEAIYIDADMGHACVLAAGCEEASVLGACLSAGCAEDGAG